MSLRFKRICAGLTSVVLLQGTTLAATVNYELDANKNVIISGSAETAAAGQKVYIQVVNQGNDKNNLLDIGNLSSENYKTLVNQSVVVVTDAEGKFSYTYKLADTASYYKIYASEGEQTDTKSFYFVTPERRQEIVDELKNRELTPSVDSLKTKVLETYTDALDVDLTIYDTIKADEAVVSKLFTYVYNNIGSVSDIEGLKKLFYGEVLAHKINVSSADEIKAICSDNENRKWISFDILASITYGYLSAEGQSALWTNLSDKTFEGGVNFASKAKEVLLLTAIEKVVWTNTNSIIEDNKDIISFNYSRYNTSLKRSDIDREIAGKKFTLAELGARIDELSLVTTDTGYQGGGITGGGAITVLPVEEPEETPADGAADGFIDIESHWAKTYIEELYELGIVNGVSANTFAPDNNVKREEFVKMLTGLFKLEVNEYDEYAFSDIPKGHWSYPYVTTARKYGILQGVDGNNFGAGWEITREDMMVLIDRTINTLNFDTLVAKYEANFADYNSISDYAKDAVINLAKRGVISGYEDGNFRGQNPATRGETAKILSAFTDYLE